VNLARGTVIKIVGSASHVDAGPLGELVCDLRGKLFRREKVRLAVGDHVELTPSEGDDAPDGRGHAVIERVLPRRNALHRARDLKRDQVLVANVDRVFLVVAVMEPPYKRAFLDRLLVGCERDRIEPVLVFNKVDLASPEYRALVEEDAGVYRALGYEALLTSAGSGEGMAALGEAFRGRVSAVIGPSGVGKSSLLNRVCPGLTLRTSEVSLDRDGRGRHTTSAAELVRLPGGGFVVDTPGVRGFALGDADSADVSAGFRELAALAPACRFRDCTHREEPECAVRQAAAAGELDEERYQSYLRLREEALASEATRQSTRRR
jgi:ribosome biogenesis GTPase